MKSLIKNLVEAVGPSGYEDQVRDLVRSLVEAYADEIRVDVLGNLIVRKGQKSPDGLRVMLSAHMDEIGIIASHIDENGFVRFTSIGGLNPLYLMGGRVKFVNGVQGTINSERLETVERTPSFDRLFVDVGAGSRSDCKVRVGDVAIFDRPFLDLGDRLVSKAMDNRISVAVLVETLRQIKQTPHELYFVFSVQEEVGLRGATTAAYGVDPDLGLAVDVTRTGDTPKGIKMEVSLGKGPTVKVRDSGMLSDPRVVRWLVDTAEKAGLPYQLEVLEAGTTDARAIQVTRAGVPSSCVSIPCRYIHSPSEMVDFRDVQNAV
ncbi:MAG: M42 family metallopeptidase, partial [Chloroflexi bacterium]|nr:M42 family metallopeptidase [Chloroflexota bacterium]